MKHCIFICMPQGYRRRRRRDACGSWRMQLSNWALLPRHCDDIRHIAPFQQRPRHFDFPNPAGVIAGDGSVPGDVVNRLLARRWIAGQSKRMVDLGPRRAFDRGRALQCDRLGAATDCGGTRGRSLRIDAADDRGVCSLPHSRRAYDTAQTCWPGDGIVRELLIVLGPSALLGLGRAPLGEAVTLVAPLSYALGTVLLKQRPPINPLRLTAGMFLVGQIFMLPAVLIETPGYRRAWPFANSKNSWASARAGGSGNSGPRVPELPSHRAVRCA